MSEWQPIETAPKDGEMVLLFVPLKHNGKFHMGAYRFDNGHWWTDSHTFVSNPSHWMPLPKPPM